MPWASNSLMWATRADLPTETPGCSAPPSRKAPNTLGWCAGRRISGGRLERESGDHLLGLVGGLSLGSPTSEMMATTQRVARDYGIPHEVLNTEEIRRRYPQHLIPDGHVGLLDPQTGYIRPEAAIKAATSTALKLGAKVFEGTCVTALEADSDGVWIRTSRGDYRVGKVIVAAGAWVSRLLPELPVPIQVHRAVLSWFQPRPGREHLFTPDRFPVFMHDDGSRRGWGAPALDASGVKVGMHDNGGPCIDDPDTNPAMVRGEELKAVTAFVRDRLPDLDPTVRRSHGCMISVTPDEAFSIGYTRSYPNVIVLAACSGHGFNTRPLSVTPGPSSPSPACPPWTSRRFRQTDSSS